MIIKTLVENTAISEEFGHEHGFSLYIETKKKKILFDVGESDLFLKNANKLNVDISAVDSLVISHGHSDHGGGLKMFLRENTSAKVFLNMHAFGNHYALRPNNKVDYIGLEQGLKEKEQIRLTSDNFLIGEDIIVFVNKSHQVPMPLSNEGLLVKENGKATNDLFAHEQNLIVEEDGKILLVVGCAHNGIINIMEHFQTLKGRMPDYVIGGFHLSSRSGRGEAPETIQKIGKYLIETKAKYYTGHCTGIEAYNQLKDIMGDQIQYLPAGSEITI